jgi:hypothetical protein
MSATRDSQWIPLSRLHRLFRDRFDEVGLVCKKTDDHVRRWRSVFFGQFVDDALNEAELISAR